MKKVSSLSSYESKAKKLFYSMNFSHGVRRAITSALALIYFLSLGFDIVLVTSLFAISTIIMTLFEFPTGAIADYDSRKKSIMISFFLIFISFLGIFLFKNFWLLALFWILNDIAWTFCSGADSAWVIDSLNYGKKESKLVKLMSRNSLFERSGYLIGGIIGFFVVMINFRFVWLIISLIYLLFIFIIWKYMEERNFKPEKTTYNYLKKSFIKARDSFKFIIHEKNRKLRIILIAGIFSVFSISSFLIAIPLYITQVLNLAPEFVSLIFSLITLASIVATFLASILVRNKGLRISLFLVWLFVFISIFVSVIPNSIILTTLGLALVSFGVTIHDILEESASHEQFSSKLRASLGSIGNITWAISNSIAIFLAGLGIKFLGVVPVIICSAFLSFIVALIYFFGFKKS